MGRKKQRKQHRPRHGRKAPAPRPKPSRSHRRVAFHTLEAFGILFALVVVFWIYSNSLRGPFVLDDLQILTNPFLRVTELSLDNVVKIATEGPNTRRVVANLSFALNYYFSGAYDSVAFHSVNVVIHLVTGVLLYFLVRATLGLPALRDKYSRHREIAGFAALIWLVHPIAAQSVAYIVQRMNGLSAMFYVASLLCYVYARRATSQATCIPLFVACGVSALLALGSKEIAATLPIFLFLYEWYFIQDLSVGWLRRRVLPLAAVLGSFGVVAIVFLGTAPLARILGGYATRDFTLMERLLTQSRVVIHYLSIIALPHPSRLSLEHNFPLSRSLVDPITTLLSLGLIVGLVWLVWWTAKRDRLASFCLLWFLGNLVIESTVIPLEIIFEHRTYLPSMWLFVLGVALLYRYAPSAWLRLGPLVVVMLVFAAWSHQRSAVWANEFTLWSDAVQKEPSSARAHLGLGTVLERQGQKDQALASYQAAAAADPNYADAHNNIGVIFEERGELDEALKHYQAAFAADPQHFLALNNIGAIYTKKRDFALALETFERSVEIHPRYPDTYKGLAIMYRAMNDQEKFNENLEKARALANP